jgi:hypothetical protein
MMLPENQVERQLPLSETRVLNAYYYVIQILALSTNLCVRDLHCCLSHNHTSVVNYEIELLM